MTSESLYKVVTDEYVSRYFKIVDEDFQSRQLPKLEISDNPSELVLQQKVVQSTLNSLRSYNPPTFDLNARSEIERYFESQRVQYRNEVNDFEAQAEQTRQQGVLEYEQKCEELKQKSYSSIAPLKKKHDELMKYKDRLDDVMEKYGITPADIELDENLTYEDFDKLLDISIKVCEKYNKSYQKIADKVDEELDDSPAVVYAIAATATLASWVLLPVISIGYIVTLVKNTMSIYSNREQLRVAENIMHTTSFDKFIPESERYVQPEYDENVIEEEIEKAREELEKKNPDKYLQQALKELNTETAINYVADSIRRMREEPARRRDEMIKEVEELLSNINSKLEDVMKNTAKLGEKSNPSPVLDTKFLIGYKDGVVPEFVDFGLNNLCFNAPYNADLLNFLKVMFVNILMNVRANLLDVVIFDKDYLGQSFSEFFTGDLQKVMNIKNKEFAEVVDEMRKKASENILTMKRGDILEFNKMADEKGTMPCPYTLYILLTGHDEKLEENKQFMEFIKYSATQGVIVWTVLNRNLPDVVNIKVPYEYGDGVEPISYDYDLGNRTIDTWLYAFEHNKVKALMYRKSFLSKYLPEEKWWTGSSIKGTNIRVGLVDGDPEKPYLLSFDDKNVHFLMGGATGAGKSVTIDCILQSMCHEYSPEELQLVYIDMKAAEAAKYVKDGYSTIPHCIVLAGTEDGEYCLSIFDWAFQEMLRRMTICTKYTMQKVEDLRKKYDDPSRPDYNPEVHLPRIVILIDEFQVMFDESRLSSKIIQKITGRITSMVKLARAAGMHLWFTSQEMSGTLAKNVLDNFSTRGALRCTEAVSMSLLGNGAAGTIREKVGWMYTNTSAGTDPTANLKWKIPFEPTEGLQLGMTELQELAKKKNIPVLRARYYREKEMHTVDDLIKAYDVTPDLRNPNIAVLGERTVYSLKTTPVNFRFMEDDNENLYCVANERQDLTDLVGTFLDNVQLKEENAGLLITSADKDTNYLLNLEQYQPEGWDDVLLPRTSASDVSDGLEEILEARQEQDSHQALYVFMIMWEKKEGIGVSDSYKEIERLKTLVRALNAYNVHFLFFSREKGLPQDLINVCNHKIAAKCDESLAMRIVDSPAPYKFPGPSGDETSFAMYRYGSDTQKFKIYRHKLERELEVREI